MDIEYRKARIEDALFILDILNSVSGDTKDIKPEHFLVAEDKKKIVGCIKIKNVGDCFMLASLAVLPDYRKKGIGSALVSKIIKENPARPLYLFCNVKNENFFKKSGFTKIETENIPDSLKKDYNDLVERNFANNTKLLIVMILALPFLEKILIITLESHMQLPKKK